MSKTIVAFDFDDTLAVTDSKVRVKRANGKIVSLTPAQYVNFQKKDGDEMDYSDFKKLKKPRPIAPYVKILKRVLEKSKDRSDVKVVILTARGEPKPIANFMRAVGITKGLGVVALDSGDPQDKKKYLAKQISKGYSNVYFIDDAKHNIEAVKTLRADFPKARVAIHQALSAKNKKHVGPVVSTGNAPDVSSAKIVNPVTKRTIFVKSALGYDKSSPAYQAAINFIKRKRGT